MILLNFTHPLTEVQAARIEALLSRKLDRVFDAKTHFDHALPFAEQARALLDGVGLTTAEWQGTALLVNPPSLAVIACVVLAELHGRMGYFPPVLRLRPVAHSVPPRFEVAEILNLQAQREAARQSR